MRFLVRKPRMKRMFYPQEEEDVGVGVVAYGDSDWAEERYGYSRLPWE